MSRRIEIELTSTRPDGTWTWRAAGAREPKGVLDGGLLYEGAKPGDVLKAEADFELDGIVIISVAAPKTDKRQEPQRIEIIGPGRPEVPGVTTQLVGRRSGDRRGDRRGGPDRDERQGRDRPNRDRQNRPQDGRPRRESAGGEGDRSGSRERSGSGERRRDGQRPPRQSGERGGSSGERAGRGADRGPSGGRGQDRRQRAPRLNPGSAHRKAVMESLPPEQQPIGEHLLRGGIPAVRTALHLEREKAEAEGRPAPNSDELLALAESLLPRLRAAEWRDRAEAAVAALETISMRDLRSVVAGADIARDEEGRELASKLRQALESRVTKLHDDWTADITAQLDAGRVVRAVRLSGRGPDPSARLDQKLAERLTEAAGATLAPETTPDLWQSLMEAIVESPIRRSVVPVGLPADPPPELKRAAHQASGSIPALAKLLGVSIPPPPAPGRKRPASKAPAAGPAPTQPEATPRAEAAADEPTTPAAMTDEAMPEPRAEARPAQVPAASEPETTPEPETAPEPRPETAPQPEAE